MITKAAPYNCTGVIWYQGENDDVDGLQELDGDMIESLINDWRDAWQDQEFPFFQV